MPHFNCQHCGRANEYNITVGKSISNYGDGWPNVSWQREWTPSRTYADSVGQPRFSDPVNTAAPPDIKEATRDTPARAPSIESDFLTPFLRTIVTGLFGGLVLGVIHGVVTPDVNFGNDIKWTFFFIVGTLGGAWVLFIGKSDKTIWVREKIEGRDIDGDGQIGRPDHVEFIIKREDKNSEGDSWELGKLPCPNGQMGYLEDFCQAIIDGYATFSERGSREGSKDPKKGAAHFGYRTRLWEELRDGFVEREWAEWRGEGRQGVEFTDVGQQMVEQIAAGDFVP